MKKSRSVYLQQKDFSYREIAAIFIYNDILNLNDHLTLNDILILNDV